MDGPSAVEASVQWLRPGGSRIMVVTGNAGAGKSVYALLLALEIYRKSRNDAGRFPVPFILSFSKEQPAILENLISFTLQDLKATELTVDAVKLLLQHGQIVFIIDGFDEISRALAGVAVETVEALRNSINRKTFGRLILTSRPAFLSHEKVFEELMKACEEEVPAQHELALYTDEQQHAWVMQNAPDDPKAQPPSRHWQRVQGAFSQTPALRTICRTPVYLRMLSEVLLRDRSVRSRYELIQQFSEEMWERERGRRILTLSNAQYMIAYETIAALASAEKRVDYEELREYLELYFAEFAPDLLAKFPGANADLINDLAIGPLSHDAGRFEFTHEVLQGYFLARLLARTLAEKGSQLRALWNRHIDEGTWEFLPEAVQEAYRGQELSSQILQDVSKISSDGLMLANIARSLQQPIPPDLFKGKHLAEVMFESYDFTDANFAGCHIHNVAFVDCKLTGATFHDARLGRLKFIRCELGAVFDAEPELMSDAEIVLVRDLAGGEEVFVGDEIARALGLLAGDKPARIAPPSNLAHEAMVVIFRALYKSSLRQLDYPEPRKIENRLRAWLSSFDIDKNSTECRIKLFKEMLQEARNEEYIVPNISRARTLVPKRDHEKTISEIVRTGVIPVYAKELQRIVSEYQRRAAEECL